MKIVINAASAKMGGAASYITGLLLHLGRIEGDIQFVVFMPPATAAKLEGSARNIRVIPTEIGAAGMLRRLWWEQVTLRRFLEKEKADVLFSTANFAMASCPVRQLLLVTNALYFSRNYRETFLPRHGWQYRLAFALRRWLICRSAESADIVMTPTQSMLDQLRRCVNVKEAVVNPYGVRLPELHEKPEDTAGERREETANRIVRLLYISLYSEHKNLKTLLKAVSILNREGGVEFKLKTTADPGWAGARWTTTYKEDLTLCNRQGIREYVSLAGPLSREATEKLYRSSDIFVFPSLAESFGFPMAEAMAYGLPIVAAATPVNREVCGEAALYFEPLSAENLAHRLLSLAADGWLRGRLGTKGRQEAASRFYWRAHVQRLLEAALSRSPAEIPGRQAVPLSR